ncbi:MAG: sensor histidine kinase [Bacteroidales bacterium]|nr:sensor histidine kinase [Bacteroidales bacterium]
MQNIQYDRQKLYYKWALILCILALSGYTFYFLYERYINGVELFKNNKSLYIRLILTVYFIVLLVFINKFPKKLFNILGFFIAVPLSWTVSLISFLTVGYEGITVTGFIFIILSSAIVFDFTLISFSTALFLILIFHFTLLSFYPENQPESRMNHIFLLGLAGILGMVTNYLINIIKNNETRVLKEREILLKEIHHRVKNNLQVISSLLDLQTGTIKDYPARIAIKDSQTRVKSMALIHQLLYQTELFTGIDFSLYLDKLLYSLQNTYNELGKKITCQINSPGIALDIDIAISLGLITNELVTNAFKYAFTNRKTGIISVSLTKNNGDIIYKVADNGIGLPSSTSLENVQTLGLKLVKLLSKQIKADISYTVKNGTEFTLVFPHKT